MKYYPKILYHFPCTYLCQVTSPPSTKDRLMVSASVIHWKFNYRTHNLQLQIYFYDGYLTLTIMQHFLQEALI